MTLEVQKPNEQIVGMKDCGRIYICDLAGTEPAGDIVYGKYEKSVLPNGMVDYKYVGPHPESLKTKELQDQGKKINLSLSEMAQFFMKMAQAIKKKKLKAGDTIPGCNSYFLCKYLKDTMLQARTYLFCAIRPEIKYHQYTFSTLTFAKNASLIKLQPKRATTQMTDAEKKLMKELQEMRTLVEQLKEQNANLLKNGGSPNKQLVALEAKLQQKQIELQNEFLGDMAEQKQGNVLLLEQRKEYERRGITLYDTDDVYSVIGNNPFFINLDEDEYLNFRYCFVMREETTVFGRDGNCKPTDFAVVQSHCVVTKAPETQECTLGAKNGKTWINGRILEKGQETILQNFDRLVIGHTMLLFVAKPDSSDKLNGGIDWNNAPTASFAATEFRNSVTTTSDQEADLQKKFLEYYQGSKDGNGNDGISNSPPNMSGGKANIADEILRQREKDREVMNRQTLIQTTPIADEVTTMFQMLNRPWLKVEAIMSAMFNEEFNLYEPQIRIKVSNSKNGDVIYMEPFELNMVHSVIVKEISQLRSAFDVRKQYVVPRYHEPLALCYNQTYHLGAANIFLEHLAYNLETDQNVEDEIFHEICQRKFCLWLIF
jgi:hypothetical protein